MKVGILTFHRGPNYGGYLQAWSLREVIRGMGHDCEIINYKNAHHHNAETFRIRPSLKIRSLYQLWEKGRMWEKSYATFADGPPATDPSEIDWEGYDAIVVGSDIVWDYQTEKFGSDDVYFGIVPGEGPDRWISYAASCGKASPDHLGHKKAEGLRSFHAIGVRDQGTFQLVKHSTGREATTVLDPTWLMDGEERVPLEETDPVLAVYGYATMDDRVVNEIKAYAKKNRLEVVAYGFNKKWADRSVLNLSPGDWIEALRRSRCIVTGTFHGTLYALRLGKVFCTIQNPWIENKVMAPLSLVNATNRLVSDENGLERCLSDQMQSEEHDVYDQSSPAREESLGFLASALSSDR